MNVKSKDEEEIEKSQGFIIKLKRKKIWILEWITILRLNFKFCLKAKNTLYLGEYNVILVEINFVKVWKFSKLETFLQNSFEYFDFKFFVIFILWAFFDIAHILGNSK